MTPSDLLQTLLYRLVKGEIDKATYEQLKTEILTVTGSPQASPTSASPRPSYDAGLTSALGARTGTGGALSQAASLLEAGQRVGQFEVIRPLGAGSFGTVYLMKNLALQEEQAVKVVVTGAAESAEAERQLVAKQRLRRKVKRTEHVAGAEGVQIADHLGQTLLLLPMEYASGGSLADWLRENHADVEKRRTEGLELWRQACKGVEALHEAGIIHLDLKPQNLLLYRDEEAELAARKKDRNDTTPRLRVKVADFGTSRCLRDLALHRTVVMGPTLGTPLYESPEQIDAARPEDLDERSDIYSLGVILYEILDEYGKPPFGGTLQQVQEGHLRKEPNLRTIPAEMQPALKSALSKSPSTRPATVAELLPDPDPPCAREEAMPAAAQAPAITSLPAEVYGQMELGAGSYSVDHEVFVPAGASLRVGPGVTLNFSPGCGITSLGRLVIDGNELQPVVMDGSGWTGVRIFGKDTAGSAITYATLRNAVAGTPGGQFGHAAEWLSKSRIRLAGGPGCGGALRIAGSKEQPVDLSFVRFESNHASESGGALCLEDSEVCLASCTFIGNSSEDGGAMRIKGGKTNAAGCAFQRNRASIGGAVSVGEGGDLDCTECEFSFNEAKKGAAVAAVESTCRLSDSKLNQGRAELGAGLHVNGGSLEVNSSTFQGNEATEGAGINLQSKAQATISYSTFQENKARNGAAICAYELDKFSAEGLTIIGNQAEWSAGGIYCVRSCVSVQDCQFESNKADNGAGIYVAGGKLKLQDSTFKGNTAQTNGGAVGGIQEPTLEMAGCEFAANSAGGGGAVHLSDFEHLLIGNCDFMSNSARKTGGLSSAEGGAVSASKGKGFGAVECSFDDNTAVAGGALELNQVGEVEMKDLDLNRNVADDDRAVGGAVSFRDCREISMTECTFDDNQSKGNGGALTFYIDSVRSRIELKECEFTSNLAVGKGGAIWCGGDHSGSLEMEDCQFDQGRASTGGAIAYEGKLELRASDTQFSSNEASFGSAIHGEREPSFSDCEFRDNRSSPAIYCRSDLNEGQLRKKNELWDNPGGDFG